MTASIIFLNVACGAKTASSTETATAKTEQTTAETEKAEEPKKEPVTLTLICGQPDYPQGFDTVLEKIQQDELITIDKQIIDNAYDVVRVKLATNEVPDLFLANVPQTVTLFNADINCEPLDNEPWVSRLVNPELLKYAKDGHIYAMPLTQSSSFFGACYYNKKVMSDLGLGEPEPKTFAEFMELLEKIKNTGNGVVPIFMSDKDSWTTQIFTTLGMGVALKDKPEVWEQILTNKVKTADVPEFVDILSKFQQIYLKGYVNKDHMSATFDNAKEAVGTGKAAMILQGEWVVGDVVKSYNADLGSFIIPFTDKPVMGTGAYVKGIWLPKKSSKLAEAKKFINCLSEPKYMDEYYKQYPDFPAFKDVNGGSVHPAVKNLVDKYIATGNYAAEFNSHFDAVNSILGNDFWPSLSMLIMGKATPKSTLEYFDKALQKAAKDKGLEGF